MASMNELCPLIMAGLSANPNVTNTDGIMSGEAEKSARCGYWCKLFKEEHDACTFVKDDIRREE